MRTSTTKELKKKRKKLSVLGVCAGQGALLYTFRDRLIANIEPRTVFHTKKEEQWKLNFGEIPFLKSYELPDCKPDIIVSSPDCGASSVMRLSKKKTLGKPNDNKSINLVIRAIQELKPKIFLIENLPRLLSFITNEEFEKLFPEYKLVFHQASVSEYGNSQISRKRLLIIGIHSRHGKKYLDAFNNKFKVKELKVTRNLLEAAYSLPNYMIPKNKVLAMYDYRKLPKKINLTVEEIHTLWNGDFSNEKKWPIKTAKMSTLPGVYRLEADKAPLTLRPADRQFRPDGWPLGISDFKNIMGFPKRYEIYMPIGATEEEYLYWLNKARYTLAKGACYEISTWFKKCLKLS